MEKEKSKERQKGAIPQRTLVHKPQWREARMATIRQLNESDDLRVLSQISKDRKRQEERIPETEG